MHAHGLPVLYAVHPVPSGNCMIDAMPTEPGAFEQRHPPPPLWASLRYAELGQVCGVPDAVFVDLGRFVGAARLSDLLRKHCSGRRHSLRHRRDEDRARHRRRSALQLMDQ